jgi:hypothetical protein
LAGLFVLFAGNIFLFSYNNFNNPAFLKMN